MTMMNRYALFLVAAFAAVSAATADTPPATQTPVDKADSKPADKTPARTAEATRPDARERTLTPEQKKTCEDSVVKARVDACAADRQAADKQAADKPAPK
jgi:hypothetical protein